MGKWLVRALDNRVLRVGMAVGISAAAMVLVVASPPLASVDAATTPSLLPSNSGRYVDTRVGEKTIDAKYAGVGRIAGGTEFAVAIAGRGDIPANAAAVMMNVTAVRPDGPGHITVYPCGTRFPNVSSINYNGGDVAPNAVLSKVGMKGQICFFSLSTTDLIVDVNGYVPAGGTPTSIDPQRRLDTRVLDPGQKNEHSGRLKGGQEYRFTIAGRSGVPADAGAAMLNITAVRPDGPGHVTVYPCGTRLPNVSSINYNGGDVAPNAVLAKLGTDGQICVYSLRATDLLIDVNAYVPDGLSPSTIDPMRYVDTRPGEKTIDGKNQGTGRLVGGKEYKFAITGRPGVPKESLAAMLNITAVRPDGPGHVTVYSCGDPRPNVSSLNYEGNDVAFNAVYALLNADGEVCVYSLSGTDLIIDVNAYSLLLPDVPSPDLCTVAGKLVDTTLTASECAALVALYSSTGGANWSNNTGWNTATDPCGWYGVTCRKGHVYALVLQSNNMVGQLPFEIGDLTSLEGLTLASNPIRGPIPSSIGNLTKLQHLRLTRSQLDGTVPATIGQLANLTILQLDDNKLNGPLPETIGNLAKLERLELTNNQLSGFIPKEIGQLSELQYLNVSGNEVSGAVPSTIGELSNLEYLVADDTKLTALPSQIGDLANLQTLSVNNSSLTGPIPVEVGELTKLSYLGLSSNQLTGEIPSTIGNLVNLLTLDLSNNELSGVVPPEITSITTEDVKLSGNDCFSTEDTDVLAWLELRDPKWDDGCFVASAPSARP